MTQFQIRQCTQANCRFRFPVTPLDQGGQRCPACGAAVQIVIDQAATPESPAAFRSSSTTALAVLVDNVRSTFNVGSIFRTADGVGVQHLYLCGITPTPQHPKLGKTALGAELSMAWSQHYNAVDLAGTLQAAGATLVALEDSPTAISLFSANLASKLGPIVLIVGNEVTGVDPGLLARCDRVLAIPMTGVKRSLNVATAFGIAVYEIKRQMENNSTLSLPKQGGD